MAGSVQFRAFPDTRRNIIPSDGQAPGPSPRRPAQIPHINSHYWGGRPPISPHHASAKNSARRSTRRRSSAPPVGDQMLRSGTEQDRSDTRVPDWSGGGADLPTPPADTASEARRRSGPSQPRSGPSSPPRRPTRRQRPGGGAGLPNPERTFPPRRPTRRPVGGRHL